MSAVGPNTAPSPFMKLPTVMKATVANYASKKDLGISASVSKDFKTAVDSNFIWEKFAKEMQIDTKGCQNIKQECLKGEEVKKANAIIIAILPDNDKATVSPIKDPFKQREAIAECIREIMWHRFNNVGTPAYPPVYGSIDNLVINTSARFQHPLNKISLVNKTVLKTLYEGVGSTLRTVYSGSREFLGGPFFCVAVQRDPEIGKAYIKGCKEMCRGNSEGLFNREKAHAVEKCCPSLLGLLLEEEASVSHDLIYEVFLHIVFPVHDFSKSNGELMLSKILEAIPHLKEKVPGALVYAKELAAKASAATATETGWGQGEAQYKAKQEIKRHLDSVLKK